MSAADFRTLYPKISGKPSDFFSDLDRLRHGSQLFPKDLTSLSLVGTVKLHGAHNDIVVLANDTIKFQSRNQDNLTEQKDSFAFATKMKPNTNKILGLKNQIHNRFLEKNPTAEIDPAYPLIIAGEWVGPGIQRGVALAQFPKNLLVIISISINGKWQNDRDYADLEMPDIDIVHVSRGGWFEVSVPIDCPEAETHAALDALQPLATEAEAECPFAKAMYNIKGRGEGIVFKPALKLMYEQPMFWLKVKGPLSQGRGLNTLNKRPAIPIARRSSAQVFAEKHVTSRRLEQGLEYLQEMHIEANTEAESNFVDWVTTDINVEETTDIIKWKLDQEALGKQIGNIASAWYLSQIEQKAK